MLKWLDHSVEWCLAGVLTLLVLIGGSQVLFRFVLKSPLTWTEEVSIVLMVWGTMLSGYVGVRRNLHLSADFAGLNLKPVTKWWLELVGLFLCLVFVAAYGWSSLKVVDAMDGIPFTSIPLKQPVLYWSLPVSAALMALALILRMLEHIRKRSEPASGTS